MGFLGRLSPSGTHKTLPLEAPKSYDTESFALELITSRFSSGRGTWPKLKSTILILCAILSTALLLIPIMLIIRQPQRHQGQRQHSQSDFSDLHDPDLRSEFLNPTPWNYSKPSPCGSRTASACASGCEWSAMTFAWYPPPCYDYELEHDFLALHDWAWYSSEEFSEETKLPRERNVRGDIAVAYISMQYHKVHCAYSFKKLLRAVRG